MTQKDKSLFKNRFFAGVVFCLFILIAILFLLTTNIGENVLKRIAESYLQHLLQQQVHISSLETNLLSRLQVRNLQIYQKINGSQIPLLQVCFAQLNYRLYDLLRKRISLRQLSVDSLDVYMQRDSLGRFNLPQADSNQKLSSGKGKSRLSIKIDKLNICNSNFQYTDKLIPLNASVDNLFFCATNEHRNDHNIQLKVDSLKIEYQEFPLTVNTIELTGIWNSQRWQVESFSALLPGLELTGNAVVTRDSSASSVNGNFLITGKPAELCNKFRQWIPDQFYPITGDIKVSVQLAGSLKQPKINLHFDSHLINLSKFAIENSSIDMIWKLDSLYLNKLNLQLFNGRITGQGKITIDSILQHQLHLKLENVGLAKVWSALYLEISPFQGKFSGNLVSEGYSLNFRNLKFTADLLLHNLFYKSRRLPDIVTRLQIKRGDASFLFFQGNSKMVAHAKLDGNRLEGNFSANILQFASLAELFNVKELNGDVELKGTLHGILNEPKIRANFIGKKIKYQNFPIDTLNGIFNYVNKTLYFDQIYFSGMLNSIDTLHPPFHLKNITGGFHYHGNVQGPVDNLRIDLMIDLFNPAYLNYQFNQGHLNLAMQDHHVNLSLLQLTGDSLLIRASGDYFIPVSNGTINFKFYTPPLDKRFINTGFKTQIDSKQINAGNIVAFIDFADSNQYVFNVNGNQLNIQKISTLLPYSVDVGGILQFDLNFKGDLANPQAGVRFQIIKPRYKLTEMDSINGDIIFINSQLNVKNLQLHIDKNQSSAAGFLKLKRHANGDYFFSDESELSCHIRGQKFDISVFNTLLPTTMKMSGNGTFDLNCQGTLGMPRIEGTLKLTDGIIQPNLKSPQIQKIQANIMFIDSMVVIENLNGIINNTPWYLKGRATTEQWQKVNLQMMLGIADLKTISVNGRILKDSLQLNANIDRADLSLFKPFFSNIQHLAGNCDMKATIYGLLNDPEVDGKLIIRGLTLQPKQFEQKFEQGVIKLEFNKKVLKIDSAFFHVNGGTVLISGDLIHDAGQISDLNLGAEISNLKIDRPEEALVQVKSARLKYIKQNSYYLLDGDIVLGESWVLYNFKPQSLLSLAEAADKPKPEFPVLLQQTRINLRIRESENIWIDNNLARLRLHSELSFIGSLLQPNLTGRLVSEEGYLLYLDRKFQVKQATLDFVNPDRLNPIVDLKAEATLKSYQTLESTQYTITLAITGSLDQVNIKLTSEPLLEQSDILALLTLGATREHFTGKDKEGKGVSVSDILRERFVVFSSEKISGYATSKVGNLLGLERMTIEGNLFQFGKSWGPQLLASKKISDRMALTYTTTVGHLNEQGIRLDYKFSKYFSVQGQTDQRGRSAIDLKYGLRFK